MLSLSRIGNAFEHAARPNGPSSKVACGGLGACLAVHRKYASTSGSIWFMR